MTAELTPTEVAVLDFEARRWKYAAVKDAQILATFGWTPTRYYQVVNALLDRPAAEAHAPATVRRLRRLRDQRAALRKTPGPR